jgi:hypothetical protein
MPELNAIVDDILRLSVRVGSLQIGTGDVIHDAQSRAGYMALRFTSTQDEHLRSLRVLVRAGQHRDAFLIARTMIEGLAQLLWAFDNRPDGPDQWFWYVVIEEWRQLKKNKVNGLEVDPETEDTCQKLLDQYGTNYYTPKADKKAAAGEPLSADPYRRKWISLDAAAMFMKIQGSDLYETVYRTASDWVHWSPRSMHLVIVEEGEIQKHEVEDPARAAQALAAGALSLLQSLGVVNDHFNIGISDDVARLFQCFSEVLKTVEEANGDLN